MANENVENAKADAKKMMSDIGTKAAYAKADLEADVEKAKATFGNKSDLEKKAAYVKADLSADVKKAKANLGNKVAHAKADAEKTKAS